ncbi:prostatic acid phosphatase-like [Oppia nitens]|uniref:prostatic acid phosphatase-like n=1 Tax=Oppia nitens TaxID=1686743 RepID=UPI0023DB51BD|nr:prostatic acid phosphatase-like [Oppia nitens]
MRAVKTSINSSSQVSTPVVNKEFHFYGSPIKIPIEASIQWPNHDISTLKLLQVIHKHGERSPMSWTPNDPYHDIKYWPEGLGELTAKGKYQMYKIGQFIRNEYKTYFGDNISPRDVYARSAASSRSSESCSALLAGAFPPTQQQWQWDVGNDTQLAHVWQPIAIETFLPEKDDLVCNEARHCKAVNDETTRIYSQSVVKEFEAKYKDLYDKLTKGVGSKIDDIWSAFDLYDTLSAELDNNYFWDKTWTKNEETDFVKQLYYSALNGQKWDYDSPIIKQLRTGGLVNETNGNFQKVVDNKNTKKIYIYSTYGAHVSALMQALNVFDDVIPPNGATLLFELHTKDKSSDYFVRIFYLNSGSPQPGTPVPLIFKDCNNQTDCKLEKYFQSNQHLLFKESQFDTLCKN